MNRMDADILPPITLVGLGLPCEGNTQGEAFSRVPALLPGGPLDEAQVLVGGKGVLERFASHPAEKLPVGSDLEKFYLNVAALWRKGKRIVALCDGDPLFFGLGARLLERFGREHVRVFPAVSSMQAAAALVGLPWEGMAFVSLHGRKDFLPLAHALLRGGPVCVLTDAVTTPAAISEWMLRRGCWRYLAHVLENISLGVNGEAQAERAVSMALPGVSSWQAAHDANRSGADAKRPEHGANRPGSAPQRLVIFEPDASLLSGEWPFGLPDAEVMRERNLLTKAPIRAAALAALGVQPMHTLWDLGAGSGAVSLDAARLTWRGRVVAVEAKAERVAMIRENRRRLGVPNLEIVEGHMPGCLDSVRAAFGRPDRIFIGGGLGGREEDAGETLALSWDALAPGGRLLVDCVLLVSLERVRRLLRAFGVEPCVAMIQANAGSPLAGDTRLEALNPVFLIHADKPV